MAFAKDTRARLARFVADARRLLAAEFHEQLRLHYGIAASGEEVPLDQLGGLDAAGVRLATRLRDRLTLLAAQEAGEAAVALLVREQAFTCIHRLAVLRLAEQRGAVEESVGEGYASRGFVAFAAAAGDPLAKPYACYRRYLFTRFAALANQVGGLFAPDSSFGLLFPREPALLDLLALHNAADLLPLWGEDETIGWMYQYYNEPAERRKMREASAAPRNSRELAVRNQFFTPRYVVEFLTDNTLGRTWYEMRQGRTRLTDSCPYLVQRFGESFLPPEKTPLASPRPTEASAPPPAVIGHRPLKDPRALRVLDPACGTMHFGLYAFELLLVIYAEAWDCARGEEAQRSAAEFAPFVAFAATYTDQAAFLTDVPRLIIEHNLHGIDIDPRAVQIAGLALWLRAQRVWQQQGLPAQLRPCIRRCHLVCAEPLPGDGLAAFLAAHLPPSPEHTLLGQLAERAVAAMQLVGEAGSLLKLEQEIAGAVRTARQQERANRRIPKAFWDKAEERLYAVLSAYAEHVESSRDSQRLFAKDAPRGFALLSLGRQRYDVVVMNPPFGDPSPLVGEYLRRQYAAFSANLLCAFIARAEELAAPGAAIGAIYDRTALVKSTYEEFRQQHVLRDNRLFALADLGWGVLDANVEATSTVFRLAAAADQACVFTDVRTLVPDEKGAELRALLQRAREPGWESAVVIAPGATFCQYPNAVLGYDFPPFARRAFSRFLPLRAAGATLFEGHTIKSADYFRFWWEVPAHDAFTKGARWQRLYNGGDYQRYVSPLEEAVLYGDRGELVAAHPSTVLRNLPYQQVGKIGYGKRGEYVDAHVVPPGFVSTVEGKHVPLPAEVNPYVLLALLNSTLFQGIINLYCGQHKYPGYVGIFPVPCLRSDAHLQAAAELAEQIYRELDRFASAEETSPKFGARGAASLWDADLLAQRQAAHARVERLEAALNDRVQSAYGLDARERAQLDQLCQNQPALELWGDADAPAQLAAARVSLLLGLALGRWDLRLYTGERPAPAGPAPFAPLPVCPPGQLQDEQGLPITRASQLQAQGRWGYPLAIPWEGILVDDPGHPLDILGHVRQVVQVLWPTDWEAGERALCTSLGEPTLDDYFRKPTGFFADHLRRYGTSRRPAPIYWPLSTKSGRYTLWLYYPRLTAQTLPTALAQCVEPKLAALRRELSSARQAGAPSSRVRELVDQEAELVAFRAELLRVSELPGWPGRDDGVLRTARPLAKLFRLARWQKELAAGEPRA